MDNEVMQRIEQNVLSWVRLYASFENTSDISSLSDGKFLLVLLDTLPNFKLINSKLSLSEELQTGKNVAFLKNISNSLIKYHETTLHKDVSNLQINSVELCMGNKSQLYRLLILTISALVSQESSKKALEEMVNKLSQDDSQMLIIMINNSQKIGELNQLSASSPSRSWSSSHQKKVFAKMQQLENKIWELEVRNKKLEDSLKFQKQSQQSMSQRNKDLKAELNKILALNEELELENEKASNKLKLSIMEQASVKKRMQLVKKQMDEKVHFLQIELEKCKTQTKEISIKKAQILKLTQINNEVRNENKSLREQIVKIENDRNTLKNNQKLQNQAFLSLKQHCCDLQVKIQQLSLACSFKSGSNQSIDKINQFGKCSIQGSSEGNRYRIAQRLGWFQNEEKLQTPNGNQVRNIDSSERNLNCEQNYEIKTISERSFENSSCFEAIKENESILINNPDVGEMNGKCKDKKLVKQENFKKNQQKQRNLIEEIRILTSIIIDLQAQIEQIKRMNPSFIMDNNSMTTSRFMKFKGIIKEIIKI